MDNGNVDYGIAYNQEHITELTGVLTENKHYRNRSLSWVLFLFCFLPLLKVKSYLILLKSSAIYNTKNMLLLICSQVAQANDKSHSKVNITKAGNNYRLNLTLSLTMVLGIFIKVRSLLKYMCSKSLQSCNSLKLIHLRSWRTTHVAKKQCKSILI